MRAWVATDKGPVNLTLKTDVPIPEVKEDYDCLIKVLTGSLNPVDAYKTYSVPNAIVGCDACGIVEKIGSKVETDTDVREGSLVYFHSHPFKTPGSFADYVVHDARALGVIPKKIYEGKDVNKIAIEFGSFAVAAQTSYYDLVLKAGLHLFPIQHPSQVKIFKNIVITGASGGVGSFAIQLARIYKEVLPEEIGKNVKIIGICSGPNFEFVKAFGPTHLIDYTKEDVVEKVREITEGEMADIYVDNIPNYEQGMACLAYLGQYISNVPTPKDIDTSKWFSQAISVHVVMVNSPPSVNKPSVEHKRICDNIVQLYEEGKIKSTVTEVIDFKDVKDYCIKAGKKHTRGKIAIVIHKA